MKKVEIGKHVKKLHAMILIVILAEQLQQTSAMFVILDIMLQVIKYAKHVTLL